MFHKGIFICATHGKYSKLMVLTYSDTSMGFWYYVACYIHILSPVGFFKTVEDIEMASGAVSGSASILPYFLVCSKASILKLKICQICEQCISKLCILIKTIDKNLVSAESQKPLGGFS